MGNHFFSSLLGFRQALHPCAGSTLFPGVTIPQAGPNLNPISDPSPPLICSKIMIPAMDSDGIFFYKLDEFEKTSISALLNERERV
jgi:hypothetical protein